MLKGEIDSLGELTLTQTPRDKEFLAQDFAGVCATAGH
jgi:hypothetical protein